MDSDRIAAALENLPLARRVVAVAVDFEQSVFAGSACILRGRRGWRTKSIAKSDGRNAPLVSGLG
jgi:hypothetical protein